jgi:hypothetical protein
MCAGTVITGREGRPDPIILITFITTRGRYTHVSSYQQTSAPTATSGVGRPATLLVAIGAAVVAALAAIVNGAIVVLNSAGVVVTATAEETGLPAEQVEAQLGGIEAIETLIAESDEIAPLFTRAYAVLISGALLLIFGLLMRKAATWTRIMVTISAVATAGFSLLVASIPEDGTNLMVMLGWIGLFVAIIALVVTWLPANGRYAKAVR